MMIVTRERSGSLWFSFCMLIQVIEPAQSNRIADEIIDVPLICDRTEEARYHIGNNACLYSYRPIMKVPFVRRIQSRRFDLAQTTQRKDHQHQIDCQGWNTHFG